MAQQIINIGAVAGDGTGDTLRDSQRKANENFSEVYSRYAPNLGVVTPSSTPTGTGVAYWDCLVAGTYTNFGGVVLSANSRGLIFRNLSGVYSITQTTFVTPTLQQITTAGATTDKTITVDVTTPTSAINGKSVGGVGVVGKSSTNFGVYAESNTSVGIYVVSRQSASGVFDIPAANTSNIIEAKKDGVNQASITHDGKLNANALNVTGNSTFNGVVTAPTATAATNTNQLATTAFVQSGLALKAGLVSPNFTGELQAGSFKSNGNVVLTTTGTGLTAPNNGAISIICNNPVAPGWTANTNIAATFYKTTVYTVATLPTIGVSRGSYTTVSDAFAPTYLGALTGGGSVSCPVFYNGTAWVSH